MRKIKCIIAFCVLLACLTGMTACTNNDNALAHTHSIQERHVDGVDCQSYGYYEIYCEFCSYSVKTPDTFTAPHVYNIFWEEDEKSTQTTPGSESRHCRWFHLCGESTDSRPIQLKPEEDLPPRPL